MHKVLDLDLDFFVWPIVDNVAESAERPNPAEHSVQTESQVRDFLEQRCGLSRSKPLIGRFVEHHIDAFTTWRDWQVRGILEAPFQVVHVDAHSDLGSGFWNDSPKFIETELLSMPLLERAHPRLGVDGMNSGNYLLAVIANRWISELKYIHPLDPDPPQLTPFMENAEKLHRLGRLKGEVSFEVNDLPGFVFLNGGPRSKQIQLSSFAADGYGRDGAEPIAREPQIPFDAIPAPQFSDSGFTHLIIAQSPAYAPESADLLLDVITQYFRAE